jgi:histidinol dehydrogenase
VLQKVKDGGDKALKKFTKDFDGARIRKLMVSEKEIISATQEVSIELKEAIKLAASNIAAFHSSQLGEEQVIETMSGVKCWRRSVAIEKVGLYIPWGNSAAFFNSTNVGNSCETCWM